MDAKNQKLCYCCEKIKSLDEFRHFQKYYSSGTIFYCYKCKECEKANRKSSCGKESQQKLRLKGLTKCRRCNEIKTTDLFTTQKTICSECSKKIKKIQQEKFSKENSRKYYRSNMKKMMIGRAKTRAKKYNLPFDIKESDIIIPEFCPVLGIKLELNNCRNSNGSSPSIDRLIPEKGYTKENARVISHRANTIKNNASLKEIEAIVKYMKENGCK